MTVLKTFLIYCLLLIASTSANAFTFDKFDRLNLASHITYFATEDKTLTFDLVELVKEEKWKKLPRDFINFGYRKETFWFKINIDYKGKEQFGYLVVENPRLDFVDLYIADQVQGNGASAVFLNGDMRNYSTRELEHPYPIFKFKLENKPMTLYLKVDSNGSVGAPVYLNNESRMIAGEYNMSFLDLYMGMVVMACGFVAFLFFLFREKLYLIQLAFTISFSVFLLVYYGKGNQWFPNNTFIQHYILLISFVVTGLATSLYSQHLFKEENTARFEKIYTIANRVGLILVLSSLVLPYSISIKLNVFYVLVVCSTFMMNCYKNSSKEDSLNIWIIFGATTLVVGCFLQVFNELNVVPIIRNYEIFHHSIVLSAISQVAILSLVAVKRVNKEKEAVETLKERLYQDEKLQSIGRMASGLIHEIKNPLTPLSVIFRMLPSVSPEMHGELVKDGAENVKRIQNIIDNLYTFASPSKSSHQDVFNLVNTINSSLKFTSDNLKEIQVNNELVGCIDIKGNETLISQVFVNVLSNASTALMNQESKANKKIAIFNEESEDKHIICVEDNGGGLSAKQIKHICDPFYKVYRSNSGLGLGMSIVYQILSQHEGEIKIESALGKWTRVKIILPKIEQ